MQRIKQIHMMVEVKKMRKFLLFLKSPFLNTTLSVIRAAGCACIAGFAVNAWSAGYLEMPSTLDVPSLETDSLLLDLDVPPLRDRDPDPQGGPRLNITEFRLQGLVEYPELGITRANIIERVEAIRFSLMRQDELGKWGYTEEEVSEIADMMGDLEGTIQDEHVGPLEVQKLVFLIREQRRRRGVTLGMVELVADEITQFYREKGFILAKAYIPEQKVRGGVVTLTLLLGELGSVTIPNENRVSIPLIKRSFTGSMNKPVTSERLEEALYLVNDIPGLRARSVLAPGSQIGDTNLNINIQEEKRYSSNIRLDNFGSEETSKNRLYGDIYLHNPSGLGDELYVALLKTYSPDNSTFGAIRYSSYWGMPRLRTSIGYSTNDFISQNTQGDSDVPLFTGESQVSDISMDYVITRRRVKNITVGIKHSNIDTLIVSTEGSVQQTSLRVKFDFLNQKRRHLYLGEVALHSVASESLEFTGVRDIRYPMLTYGISRLSFPTIPFTDIPTRMLLSTSGQFSGESTSNVTQFNLTGVGRARAFSVNGVQGDDGIFASVDWIFSLPKLGNATFFGTPLHQVFQPYVFADYGYGKTYAIDSTGTDSVNSNVADVGAGIKMDYAGVKANMFFGSVVLDNKTASTTEEEAGTTPTSTFNFEVSYAF